MEREEFKLIVKGMKAVYAQPTFIADADAFDMWYELLKDLPYQAVSLAASTHMARSPYPPTIADLREICMESADMAQMSVDDAWGMVLKAVRTYGYMREAEALESFPEPCRTVVKNIGWQNICQSENPVAERAFFRDSYGAKSAARKKENVLPEECRNQRKQLDEQIKKAAARLTLGGDKNGQPGRNGTVSQIQS